MKRFRLRNNVPDTYVTRSRDFQYLCDLFDIVNNGVKFDIDTIRTLNDTELCRDSMLKYLQTKLGFDPSSAMSDTVLRRILKSFPYIVKYKGSRRGITAAICLFLNIILSEDKHTIEVVNINDRMDDSIQAAGNYIICINLKSYCLRDLDILDDLLSYVVPAGYSPEYIMDLDAKDLLSSKISTSDNITVVIMDEDSGSRIYPSAVDSENHHLYHHPLMNSIGTTLVRVHDVDSNNQSLADNKSYEEEKINEYE